MAEPVRVLQLVKTPQRRGAEVFAAQLSAMLRSSGDAVVRTAYLYPNAEPAAMPLVEDDIVIGRTEDNPAERVLGANPTVIRRLVRVIDEFRPEVIQANGSRTVKYAAMASVVRRGVSVVYRNNGDPSEWVNDRRRRFLYGRLVFPRLDGVVAVSQATLPGIRALHPKPILTGCIPQAVDIDAFQPRRPSAQVRQELGADPDAPVVLHVGSLRSVKRPDRLARLFSGIRTRVPEAELWVAGSGPLAGTLKDELASTGDLVNARLLGVRDDVADLMNAADLVVLTSDVEGTPSVLLEAGAMSRAVVATDVGGVGECIVNGRTGTLVDPADEEGLVQACVTLLRDPFARKRMGIEARYHVMERFALSAIAQEYARFYRMVLGTEPNVAVGPGLR